MTIQIWGENKLAALHHPTVCEVFKATEAEKHSWVLLRPYSNMMLSSTPVILKGSTQNLFI